MKVKQKRPAEAAAMLRDRARSAPTPSRRARAAEAAAAGVATKSVRRRAIEDERDLVEKVHALFQPGGLRAARAGGAPAKCVTPQIRRVVREVGARYAQLSPRARREISKYIRLKKRGRSVLVEYPGGED